MKEQTNPYGYDVAHIVYDLAIDANVRRRENLSPTMKDIMRGPEFLEEWCTVHVNIGRQSGKSSYITRKMAKTDIAIVHNHSILRGFQYDIKKRHIQSDRVITSSNFLNGLNPKNINVNVIWIDEPTLCFKTRLDWVYFYSHASALGATTIIKLGC